MICPETGNECPGDISREVTDRGGSADIQYTIDLRKCPLLSRQEIRIFVGGIDSSKYPGVCQADLKIRSDIVTMLDFCSHVKGQVLGGSIKPPLRNPNQYDPLPTRVRLAS